MITDLESNPQQECSVFADLAALICRGGLVVGTPGELGSIAVQSTMQLDGDMTICVARSALGHTVLLSHLDETEKRLRRLAVFVKRTVRVAHAIIGVSVSVGWIYPISYYLSLEDPITAMAIWIGLSVGSCAAILRLFRTHFIQKMLLTAIVSGLARLAPS